MEKVNPVLEENEIDPMEALVRQADADRDRAIAELAEAHNERDSAVAALNLARKQCVQLSRQLRNEREIYEKELRRANGKKIHDIRLPFILFLAFAAMALVVGLLVKGVLISHLLGEPLTYGCICVCSFFGGIVWARTEKK